MNVVPRGSKKRKNDSQDSERSLYASFSHAANAVSQLYTAAVQQTKRAEEAGARQSLERVAQFVLKEYGNAPAVPTAVLMEVLRQELQAAQGSAAAIQLPFPVPLLPLPADSDDVHSDDEHTMSEQPMPGAFRRSHSGTHISPPKGHRGAGGQGAPGPLPAMFQQQLSAAQQQQQQQMQAAHVAQVQAAMQQQQQQQQGHQQGGFGFPGQQPFHH